MQPEMLRVELGARGYPVWIGEGVLGHGALLEEHLGGGAVGVVTNAIVAPLYLNALERVLGSRLTFARVLPDGEEHKNLATVESLYDTLAETRVGRDGTLIALGGGVIGDITGFVAATWQRGIGFVQVPTTLLAQVDSSVGGKTGVNHPRGKNLVGAFHQPRCVLADVGTLATLPAREYAAGLAEVLKYGLIGDAAFYHWIEANALRLLAREPRVLCEAIRRSCAEKARVVAQDEREGEGGTRALLNFGHTFGHALETLAGYGKLLHGEAVAIGMVMAAELSRRMGWLGGGEVAALRALLGSFGLPVGPPPGSDPALFLDLMRGDKKAAKGRIRLILLRRLGEALLSADYPEGLLRAVVDDACAAGNGV